MVQFTIYAEFISAVTKRVVFCTYPSLYSDIVLDSLLSSSEIELVGVIISTRTANTHDGFIRGAWRHLQRSGIHYSVYQWAVTAGYESLGKFSGRQSFRKTIETMGIPVWCTQDINDSDSLAFVEKISPDILLSAHFNQLIKPTLLSFPSLDCINIHPSLLPDFKGVDPGFFMLMDEAEMMGVTVHLQSDVFDEGEILAQRILHNHQKQSLMALNMSLFQLGADAAVEVIAADSWIPQPQITMGRYDSWPSKAQVRSFRARYKLLALRQWFSYAAKRRHSR